MKSVSRGYFEWRIKSKVPPKLEKPPIVFYYKYDGIGQSTQYQGVCTTSLYNKFYYTQRKRWKRESSRYEYSRYLYNNKKRLSFVKKKTQREKRTQDKLTCSLIKSIICNPDSDGNLYNKDMKKNAYELLSEIKPPLSYLKRPNYHINNQSKIRYENRIMSYYINKYTHYFCKWIIRSYILKRCKEYIKPRTIRLINRYSKVSYNNILKFYK